MKNCYIILTVKAIRYFYSFDSYAVLPADGPRAAGGVFLQKRRYNRFIKISNSIRGDALVSQL